MRDNRGFSLIELIVAMAIIVILAGGTTISRSMLVLADAHKCARVIDQTLSKLKLETMSKGDKRHYLVIEWDSTEQSYYLNAVTSYHILTNSNWEIDADTIKRKKLADDTIRITYSDRLDGSNIVTVNDSNPYVLISILPESGAYQSPWKQIIVTSGADTLTIYMVTETGKHYITS